MQSFFSAVFAAADIECPFKFEWPESEPKAA
jgi:hypothetical protein